MNIVCDGITVPTAKNPLQFSISGPGEIVATDNGDPTDMTPFPSHERNAFNGLALVIIRSISGAEGDVRITANSGNMQETSITIKSRN